MAKTTAQSQQMMKHRPDPANFFAQISAAYIEVLAGMRRPEQLARWLTDRAYYDICQRAKRESRARQLTGYSARPDIVLRSSKTFLTDFLSYQGVVVLQISGATRAVSVRAELIHNRYRITDLTLI
jgi:tRNA G37 N-methylase Trm5